MGNLKALVELAEWLGVQHARSKAGLPSEWNQGVWALRTPCGTVCCAAGHVALGLPEWEPKFYSDGTYQTFQKVGGGDYDTETARDLARRELDIDWDDANDLFSGDNDYKDMMRVLKRCIATAVEENIQEILDTTGLTREQAEKTVRKLLL